MGALVAATGLGVAAGLGSVLSSPMAASAAVSQIQVGVWAQSGGAPAPPTVPSGGLWVQSTSNGPTAISALRITSATTDTAPQLTLNVSKYTAPPATAQPQAPLLACPITGSWQPTDPSTPGAWSSAPTYDCTKAYATAIPSPDGTKMAMDLSALEDSSGVTNVALVPGQFDSPITGAAGTGAAAASTPPPPSNVLGTAPAPPAPAPTPADPTSQSAWPTYDATFNAPKPADVAVTENPAPPPSSIDQPADTTQVASAPLDTTATLPAAPSVPVDTTPVVASPTPQPPAAQTTPVVQPVVTRVAPRRLRPAAAIDPTSKTARTLSGLAFLALCAWAWQIFSKPGALTGDGLLSIYDMPATPLGAIRRRQLGAASARVGKAPALR